jgi:hypothetical protein
VIEIVVDWLFQTPPHVSNPCHAYRIFFFFRDRLKLHWLRLFAEISF